MQKIKNKSDLVSIILTCICIVLGVVMYFILPEEIAVQWSGKSPSNVEGKIFILLFPGLALLFLFIGKALLNMVLYKWFHNTNEKLVSYLNAFLQVVFLTCELYIVLFEYGMRLTISSILIIELVVGIIIGVRVNRK